MRLKLGIAMAAALLLATAGAGCIKNMGDLKEVLGYGPDTPEPGPEVPPPEAPIAAATANATTGIVGAPIRFSATGSTDPQGSLLDYQWNFGDGLRGTGETITHVYGRPGTFEVVLTVTNSADLSDTATLTVTITPGNRAPVAVMGALNANGEPTTKTLAGSAVKFTSAGTTDPDNDALSYAWDFGDGSTSTASEPTHTFGAPGVYVVALEVKDPAGLTGRTSKAIAVDYVANFTGAFEAPADVAPNTTKSHQFPVAEDAASLTVTLRFDASNGVNEINLEVLDAEGAQVHLNNTETEFLASGTVEKTITLPSEGLNPYAAGTWTVNVIKTKGLQVAYTVEVVETV